LNACCGAGLIIQSTPIRLFLEPSGTQVDAVVLLDSQDWMAPKDPRALNAIDRTGSDSVRLIFRTAGGSSAGNRGACAPLRIWRRDEERALLASSGTGRKFWQVPLLRTVLIGSNMVAAPPPVALPAA
jgi:hypothetical protein